MVNVPLVFSGLVGFESYLALSAHCFAFVSRYLLVVVLPFPPGVAEITFPYLSITISTTPDPYANQNALLNGKQGQCPPHAPLPKKTACGRAHEGCPIE